jgi:hypothetical protein
LARRSITSDYAFYYCRVEMGVDMNRALKLLGAGAFGAGLMYLFDPDRGKRRRALLRNKAEHARRIAVDAAGKTRCDVRNRLR